MPKAQIISIGDELLLGVTVNTNAPYIARRLAEVGIPVVRILTVGDEMGAIVRALEESSDADIVVTTGGIGPTHDDVTVAAVAAFLGTELVEDESTLARIRSIFQERRTPTPESSAKQALVPKGAVLIENPLGMAPGLHVRKGRCQYFVLPGVPSEMQAMVDRYVLPIVRDLGAGEVLVRRVLRTTGIYESALFDRVGDLDPIRSLGVRVAFLPGVEGVDIGLSVEGKRAEEAQQVLDQAESLLRSRVGEWIYGVGETPLEEVVAELFFRTGKTVSTAESCTGGLLAHRLTNVAGSSTYFERGVVAYSNQAKVQLLGVREETLRTYGAVSEPTAIEMAEGVRRISGTDFGVSTTGIAGPGGGTPEKPVGLVYIGFSDGRRSYARQFYFRRERLFNKTRAALAALDLLRRELLQLKRGGEQVG
ncbi:MAG: competence/damage-inducible protein A [candidate division KSB1 bacterium]|nr:competence/damage-inducible protein A [candidate division KSB1 bacterium]